MSEQQRWAVLGIEAGKEWFVAHPGDEIGRAHV